MSLLAPLARGVALATALGLAGAAATFAGAEAIDGKWKVVEAERGGKPNPAELDAVLSFDGETLEIDAPGGPATTFEVTVDTSATPARIDLHRGAADKRITLEGIWRITDGRLTLCIAAPFQPRPTTFTTAAGSAVSLTVHERVPPSD